MKRLTRFFVCLCLILMMFATIVVSAQTIASGQAGTKLTWTLDSTGVLTISGEGDIPSYTSYTGTPWYKNRASITSIVISEGVGRIGDRAFYRCSNIETVSFPQTLTAIGNYAFRDCSALVEAEIPDGVTTIGNYAFRGCSSLEAVHIPESALAIGSYAFQDCSVLTAVEIPKSVLSIGTNAFRDCEYLEEVILNEGLESIGDGAFEGCVNLIEIWLPASVTSYGSDIFAECDPGFVMIAYSETPGEEYCIQMSEEYGYEYGILFSAKFYADSELIHIEGGFEGDFIWLPECEKEKEGYNFTGWLIDGKLCQPGDIIFIKGNMEINASYQLKTYQVRFVTGSGNDPAPLTKNHGQDLTLNVTASNGGYKFLGWSLSADGATLDYKSGDVFNINADTTLYAVWEEETYVVQYRTGTDAQIPNQIKKFGKKLQISDTVPLKSGHTFLGWSLKQSATEVDYRPGELFDLNQDTVLFAVWAGGVISGDADNNGAVDVADLMHMINRINEIDMELTQDNVAAMDVYKDTYFNIKDILKMTQYLANWTNVILGE